MERKLHAMLLLYFFAPLLVLKNILTRFEIDITINSVYIITIFKRKIIRSYPISFARFVRTERLALLNNFF